MHLASRTDRFAAQFIDGIVTVLPLLTVALAWPASGDTISTAGGILLLAGAVFAVAYYLFADALPGGQSLGKHVLGIAVVDQASSAPCSAGQAFLRNFLASLLGMLDWIFIFGERRQRLGDMAARTIVVECDASAALDRR
ncbi:MAG TPA: RDD family protein [Longimicrobium sp.]|nr:RDD family protein [Longimicrobium sp.]